MGLVSSGLWVGAKREQLAPALPGRRGTEETPRPPRQYACVMTLILGMSKPEGIYLSVDYRVTDSRTGALIDDASTKSLTIHYPPLESNNGPRVLLGFTGVALLPDGTPTMTWIRETLRGQSEGFDQSMAHFGSRLDRDIGPQGVPLIVHLLVLDKDRRLFGGFTNLRRLASGKGVAQRNFEYVMQELEDPLIFANGSGAVVGVAQGDLARLQPHLGVVPREPMNHMKLLASVNRRIANKDRGRSVSPFCQVSFINADDRFGPSTQTFVERGESVPFDASVLLAGVDLTDTLAEFMRNSAPFLQGKATAVPELSSEIFKNALKRRP